MKCHQYLFIILMFSIALIKNFCFVLHKNLLLHIIFQPIHLSALKIDQLCLIAQKVVTEVYVSQEQANNLYTT